MPVAMIDELALVRILSNLIGNALRYSEAGSAVIIDAALEDGSIRIDVGDSGPGMGDEQRAQIGQPYVAAPRTHGGAGLGLFIVRSLVEAHGGSLTTVSEAGKGARFTVRLPLQLSVNGTVANGSHAETTSFLS
jgi:cell cycle sensor histidine kinase DivJ